MFEFNTWVVDHLINGVKRGAFSKEWAAVQLANYYVKGKLTEADIRRFEEATAVLEPAAPESFPDVFFVDEFPEAGEAEEFLYDDNAEESSGAVTVGENDSVNESAEV